MIPRGASDTVRTALFDAKLTLLGQLEYRAAFFIWVFGDVAQALFSLSIWLTVSEHSARLPLDRSQLVTYFVAEAFVSTLTISWLVYLVPEDIREGHLSAKLLSPVTPLTRYVGDNFGQKGVRLLLLAPLALAAGILFREQLRLPAEPGTWALFAVAVVLAMVISFLLDMVISSLSFWIQDVWGVESSFRLAERFLDGGFIPLAFFPPWLLGFAHAQPFRYTLSFPLEVLTGALTPDTLAWGFAWQTGYAVGLYALYRVQWHYGLRSYSAAGA